MRALILAALVAAVTTAAPGRAAAQATCVAMAGCAEGCACGDNACIRRQCGGPEEWSGPSAADLAAEMARREQSFQLQLAEAQARGVAAAAESVRRKNDEGIAAAKKNDWQRAISHFESALLLDPSNAQIAQNLEDARVQVRLVIRQREIALGPTVGSLHGNPMSVADATWVDQAPAIDTRGHLENVQAYLGEQTAAAAREAVEESLSELDVTTPWGMYLRIQLNIATLARDLPDWIMSAARGEMSLDEAANLPLRASTMLLNVGTAPGRFFQRMVELGSAGAAALEVTEARVSDLIEGGIESLAARAGVDEGMSRRALELGKEHADEISRWVQPGSRP